MDTHAMLTALDSLSNEPIKLVINSPGGELDSALLLYDLLRTLKSPVTTLGYFCASAAVFLLGAGQKRYLMPHSKVMLHLPWGEGRGDAKQWDVIHREMAKYQEQVVSVLQECGAKRNREEILEDIDREFWLEPQEVIDYGLADEIVTPKIMQEWLGGPR